MQKRFAFILICLLCPLFLYAQSVEYNEETAKAYSDAGIEYYNQGVYDNALSCFEQALKIYTSLYEENHPDIAALYNNIGLTLNTKGEYEKALVNHKRALKLFRILYGENHPDTAASYNNIGVVLYTLSDYKQALSYYEKALEIIKAVYGENHPDVAMSYCNIGIILCDLGEYEKALAYHEKSLAIRKSVYGDYHSDTADSYCNLGIVIGIKGDNKKALANYEKALEIYRTVYGEDHPRTAAAYHNIGTVLQGLGEYEEAFINHKKALEIRTHVYGENHPETLLSYNNIGNILHDMGKYEESLIYHAKALEICKKLFGENHIYTANSYNNIGVIFKEKGDYDKSLIYSIKSLEIRRAIYGENHPDTGASYNNIGLVLNAKGDYDKAISYYKKAIGIYESIYGENHVYTATLYSNIGAVFNNKDDYEKSLTYYIKALENRRAIYGENHPDTASTYNAIGALLYNTGNCEQACIYHGRALEIRKNIYGENHPDTATSYYNLGQAYLELHDRKSAYENFYKCMQSYQNTLAYFDTIIRVKKILSNNIEDTKLIDIILNVGIDTVERARLDMSSIKTNVMKQSMSLYYYGVQFESSRNNALRAFEYSESLRNRGFLEQLGTETALNLDGVTVDEKNELHNLMEQITASRNVIAKLANAETDIEKERYKNAGETLTEAEKKLTELDETIGKRISAYAQLRNTQPVKATDAQKWCGNKRAILEYVLPYEDSESGLKTGAYCLIVTADGIKSVPLDSEYDYYTAVAELRSAVTEKGQNLSAGSVAAIHKYRTALYEKLIEPVLQYIPSDTEKLLVVPDGSLSSLPFDILGKPDEKLLGEQYALSFSPSVSVSMFKEMHIDKTINMLGIGNAIYSETESSSGNRGAVKTQNVEEAENYDSVSEYYRKNFSTWRNIPWTGQEMKNLKTVIFPKDKVDIFEQTNATEKLIKQLSQSGKLADYNQILIACHGYFNTEKPEMSTLVFSEISGTVKDSTEDGYLTVDELALLKMNAQFLNLSACQTGLSAERQGDGMLGLTRFCIIAGADNVGVTLWSVDDKATCVFQKYLYGFIKEDMPYPEAYQKAKEKMKASEEWTNLEYWAGFVLYE